MKKEVRGAQKNMYVRKKGRENISRYLGNAMSMEEILGILCSVRTWKIKRQNDPG